MEQKFKDIIIVGGGYSGTMLAVNLLKNITKQEIKITIINEGNSFSRGLAYQAWDDNFLLNVPAGNMSALDSMPNNFVEYCKQIDPAFNEGSFVSRRIYGDYLEKTLEVAEREAGSGINRIFGQVVTLQKNLNENGFNLHLADGQILQAGKVVLALGHFLPNSLSILETFKTDANYLSNPWDFSKLDKLPKNLPVLIIGTGLTAIDTLFRLTSVFQREVILISRKGLHPQGHRVTPKLPLFNNFPSYLNQSNLTVRNCFRALRNEVSRRNLKGGDWRDVINELRAYTPEIWARFSNKEKKRFLDHVVRFWDIHRHRIAPIAFQRFEKLLNSNQVKINVGRITKCSKIKNGFEIDLRQGEEIKKFFVGGIVNCIGPNSDLSTISSPLISQLLKDGLISQDVTKVGLMVSDEYEVIGSDGVNIPNLYYVGPMLKAKFWEAIAVPELRQHARKVAERLLLV